MRLKITQPTHVVFTDTFHKEEWGADIEPGVYSVSRVEQHGAVFVLDIDRNIEAYIDPGEGDVIYD